MAPNVINQNLAQAPFNEQLEWILTTFKLESKELADSLVTDEQIINQWLDKNNNENELPQKPAVEAMKHLVLDLNELFEPEQIVEWVNKSNSMLQGRSPKEYAKEKAGIIVISNLVGALGR